MAACLYTAVPLRAIIMIVVVYGIADLKPGDTTPPTTIADIPPIPWKCVREFNSDVNSTDRSGLDCQYRWDTAKVGPGESNGDEPPTTGSVAGTAGD